MLRLQLRRTFPTQDLAGIAVDPVYRLLDFTLADSGEIGPFGEEPAEQAVVVLVSALLPGGIAVAVVDRKALSSEDRSRELVILQKFRAVICGDALEQLLEPPFAQPSLQPVEDGPDRFGPLIRDLEGQFVPARQGQQSRSAPLFPHLAAARRTG